MSAAGKHIILGVTGSIAAYKAVLLLRELTTRGAQVTVVMSANAEQFVGPLTFRTLSGRPVLSSLFDSAGISQVYRQLPDGTDRTCLTCTTVKGPNGFAQARGQGDWILFHSYGQQPVHTGGPGLGGYGGDLYVMRADG